MDNNTKSSPAILLLQGPLGCFFSVLAKTFSQAGYAVHRIVFNGGDQFYATADYVHCFNGTPQAWQPFLYDYLLKHDIETVFVFGDCRFYHREARQVCQQLQRNFMVFEEGYLRPNTITLELDGVNAHSKLNLSLARLQQVIPHSCESTVKIGATMATRAKAASLYYWAAWFAQHHFPHYHHHRAFHPVVEGAQWIRSSVRKWRYYRKSRQVESQLQTVLSGRFYLVALQVHDDSQIKYHSDYTNIEAFIEEVVTSFAQYAPSDTVLVLKHHPMDRGYTDYTALIQQLGERFAINERLIYCHDVRLPAIYQHCRGVVTVNSTVGMSALLHNIPVKVTGQAMYDITGLTSQCSLNDFWQAPQSVNTQLFQQLQTLLFDRTQINGSFFTQLEMTCNNVVHYYQAEFGTAITQLPPAFSV